MAKRSTHHPFPSHLSPLSLVIVSLFYSMNASATPTAALDNRVAEVSFDDSFLQQSGGAQHIDVSRFNKGNVMLPGTYRADLYVNNAWLGRREVILRPIGPDNRNVQPCFDRALLEQVGVDLNKLTPQAATRLKAEAGSCVQLSELVENATAVFDGGELRLDVSVPQIAMGRQARGYVEPQYWDEGVTAARLMYNGSFYRSESQGNAATEQGYLGLNTGLNIGPWRLQHMGNLNYNDQSGTSYQRIQTNLQRSIAPLKSQLVIGEAFTDGALFNSVGFRGVQLASDDRMYPESQRGYAPTIRGIANSNARVQVRQNGNIIYETTVAAGAFEIDDLYPTGYGGNLEVVVTEADGTVRVSQVPYAAAVNALRPGVTRYSVVAGDYRNPSVQETPRLVQGTLQHGFTNLLTGYSGLQLADEYTDAMVGMALNTNYGAFGLDISQAKTQLEKLPNRSGQSMRLSYSKLIAPTDTNVTLAAYRYSTKGYLSLDDAMQLRDLENRDLQSAMSGTPRGRLQATVNQSLAPGYGSFYLTGSTQDYWNQSGRDTQFQVGYNNNYKRINYGISAARQLNLSTGQWDNQLMLNVSIPLGESPYAPYSSTSLQSNSSGASTLQESIGGSLGAEHTFNYNVNAGHSSGGGMASTSTVGANASYITPMTTLNGSVSQSGDYQQVSAGMSGGVVAYSGGLAFTPTAGDTMAIVEAENAAGARIASTNGLRVDPWGHALISTLTPFARNQIEIDPKGLPLNVELKSSMQQIAPTAGAVVKVKFDTTNAGRAAIIQVKTADGKALPFGADVFDAAGQPVGVVAQGGRIVARGLKSDSGKLTVKWGEQASETCMLAYALPKVDAGNAQPFVRIDAQCK